MPVYSFVIKETGEEYEMTLTYDELIQYLEEHPEVNQKFRMNVVDPVGIGVTKPPVDFQKHVLGRIKSSVPNSDAIGGKRWDIPREV
jgi:hypothetical protein